jgi:hypothetical protein
VVRCDVDIRLQLCTALKYKKSVLGKTYGTAKALNVLQVPH